MIILITLSFFQFFLFYLKSKFKHKYPDFYISILFLIIYYFVFYKSLSLKYEVGNTNFVVIYLTFAVIGTIFTLLTHLLWFLIKRRLERNS
ncbi:hypothetical protein LPB136_00490 [Tenacibaculum todarodis]|uniref:Uncharacterized protein n=1 Tax=Tenacibaculum todarodis TaxID=1850252 RepID=A0A1L3JFP2_9FLAO|nr:hypothetical protein LPB136_00490 [Tenacibaculum todarodis]